MRQFALFVLAVLVGGVMVYLLIGGKSEGASAAKESAYERVMRTGTLRCGYAVRPPLFQKDPNSGAVGGLFHDYTEAVATLLGVKVEWAEEVGWGEIVTALNTGRIDAFCGGMWPNASRIAFLDFTTPVAYEPLYVFIRADDGRFGDDLSRFNNPNIRLISVDGTTPSLVAKQLFPKATLSTLPQLSPISDVLVSVVTGKADASVLDVATALEFEISNPGKIKRVKGEPLRSFALVLGVGGGEYRLKRMLDLATDEFIQTGAAATLFSGKYEAAFPSGFTPPASPVRE